MESEQEGEQVALALTQTRAAWTMHARQTSITPGMQVKVVNSYDADSLRVDVSLFSSVD